MSFEAFTAAFYCSQQRAGTKFVLAVIGDGTSNRTDDYYGSVESIAEIAGYNVRFTREQIARLIAAGELVVIERPGKSNIYIIPLLPGEEGYAPESCDGAEHRCNRWHTPITAQRSQVARRMRHDRLRDVREARKKAGSTDIHPGTIAPASPRHDSAGVNIDNDPGTIAPGGRHDSAGGAAAERRGGGTIAPPNLISNLESNLQGNLEEVPPITPPKKQQSQKTANVERATGEASVRIPTAAPGGIVQQEAPATLWRDTVAWLRERRYLSMRKCDELALARLWIVDEATGAYTLCMSSSGLADAYATYTEIIQHALAAVLRRATTDVEVTV